MDYIKDAVRTDLQTYEPVLERLQSKQTARLIHGMVGISTESGELLDALKKHLMYGKSLDLVNIKEEVGDVLWYCALILDEVGASFEDVMKTNIDKLRARFPEKFTEEKAVNRDLDTERKILEGQH